jgi:IclR family transcriptional regulator, KDG regulon repressor
MNTFRAGARMDQDKDTARASSAATMLDVFEFIGTAKSRSLKELMEAVPRPKSTLLRIIATLVEKGFVQRIGSGKYAVTLKAWRLGAQALNYDEIEARIVPTLKQATVETGESALYAVYEQGFAVYIEKASSPQAVGVTVVVGDRSPSYATATGKVLLAHQPPAEVDRVIAEARPHSQKTIVDRAALLHELENVKKQGIASTRGEWREEVSGVAAPVFDHTGSVIAALGILCPSHRFDRQQETLNRAAVRFARKLSTSFGAPQTKRNGGIPNHSGPEFSISK